MSQTDFNDLHVTAGLEEVRRQVLGQLQASEQSAPSRQLVQGEEPPPPPEPLPPDEAGAGDEEWRYALDNNKEGHPKAHVGNLKLILSHDERWRGCLGYCDFSYRVIKHTSPMAHMLPGEWEDADTARVREWMNRFYRINPSRTDVLDAVIVTAQENRFHPVRDYLNGLVWDGVPRLDKWLKVALGSEGPPEYLARAGSKFMIGAVARIMRPGCKMDNVLILEGEQGRGKSSTVRLLFQDWYSDSPLPLGEKDAYQAIQGIWGVEIAELDSFNKAESTTSKSFFSQMRDRYRPSYGHMTQDFPRQCVFIATTNQDEYLKDYSGNRRYWPVRAEYVDTAWLEANVDQLWAEARHRFRNSEPWWIEGEAERQLFYREQDARQQLDPWHYMIENWLHLLPPSRDFVTSDEVITEALKKDSGHVTRADQNRLSPIMKVIGWDKKKKLVPVGGGKKRQRHVYLRPDNWESFVPGEDEADDYAL